MFVFLLKLILSNDIKNQILLINMQHVFLNDKLYRKVQSFPFLILKDYILLVIYLKIVLDHHLSGAD